jgi:hypothetical protein
MTMEPTAAILTAATLNNGVRVLAKADGAALQCVNRTQAQRRVETINEACENGSAHVYQAPGSRVFYVALPESEARFVRPAIDLDALADDPMLDSLVADLIKAAPGPQRFWSPELPETWWPVALPAASATAEPAAIGKSTPVLQAALHCKDADCTIGDDGYCVICGVYRNDAPCPSCGGWSFHVGDCPELEAREEALAKNHGAPPA